MSRHASGLMAWLIQRVSAVYLAVFFLYLLIFFSVTPPPDHAALQEWVRQPWVGIGLLLFVPLLLAHAWVGVRNVLIDYVHSLGWRIALLSLFAFIFLASGLWTLMAIVTVGLAS